MAAIELHASFPRERSVSRSQWVLGRYLPEVGPVGNIDHGVRTPPIAFPCWSRAIRSGALLSIRMGIAFGITLPCSIQSYMFCQMPHMIGLFCLS